MSPTSSRTLTARRDIERLALLTARSFIDDMRLRYQELERRTGASINMHRALACIAREPGLSASGLANALGMKRPALSHLLKGLAERGWVDRLRTAADQRAIQLRLTAGGQQLVHATAGRAVGTLHRAVGRLSNAEVAALSLGLTALMRELPEPSRSTTTRAQHQSA